jgi:2,3,4,5-tetrahydropyridine-2-carboxylate N-succinyltransferase
MTDKLARMETTINAAWDVRESIDTLTEGETREAVNKVLNMLDSGILRVASPSDEGWVVHQWVKKAVLLSFKLNPMQTITGGPDGSVWYDKVKNKFVGWGKPEFEKAGFRVVPDAIVRHSAYVAPGAVLMQSFLNVGAYVGKGTMIDTWVTIGSCAQVGENCHISEGVGIGGVLEPLNANPVIIEDNVFIGAGSKVVEGVIIEEGSVLAMGVFLGDSTKIIDRKSGELFYGRVPAYSVVVPGTLPSSKALPDGSPAPSLACAVIVKRVDERTRSKTSVNDLLRN